MNLGRLNPIGVVLLAALAFGASASARRAPRSVLAIHDVDPDAADRQTRDAFRAAFGRASPARLTHDGVAFDFIPVTAVALGGGRIALVTTGISVEGGHSSPGVNAVHYLAREGGRLRVTGRWFGVGVDGSDGRSATRWAVSRALSRRPVVYLEGGGVWQGCRVAFATLTELRPAGPVDVADFPVGYSDVDTGWTNSGRAVEGALASAVPDRSFTVRYTGSMRFIETYTRSAGGAYRLAGGRESQVPAC